MILTPAIKGQLTKAIKANEGTSAACRFAHVLLVFKRHMPREQAKHAARKYLAHA